MNFKTMNTKLYGPTARVNSIACNQGAKTMKTRNSLVTLAAAALAMAALTTAPAAAQVDDAPIAAELDGQVQAQTLPPVTVADAAPKLDADAIDLPLGMPMMMPGAFDATGAADAATDAAGGAGVQAVSVGDWKFRSLNAFSDKCLDLAMNGTYRLYQHECNGGRNQQWMFEPTTVAAPNGFPYYRIRSEWGGVCVTATTTKVYVATCQNSSYQHFAVEPGFYSKTGLTARVKARAIGRYLRVNTTADADLITDTNPNVVSAAWQVIP